MKLKKLLLSALVVPFVSMTAFNTAQAVDLNVDAEVVTVLTVSEVNALDFGRFATAGLGGDVTFNAGGSISADADITLLGGEQIGLVSVTAPASANVTVDVVGTTLTAQGGSGGAPMNIVGNCQGPNGGALGSNNGFCQFTSTGGVQNIEVGGVLSVNAAQAPDVYAGTMTVTANFTP